LQRSLSPNESRPRRQSARPESASCILLSHSTAITTTSTSPRWVQRRVRVAGLRWGKEFSSAVHLLYNHTYKQGDLLSGQGGSIVVKEERSQSPFRLLRHQENDLPGHRKDESGSRELGVVVRWQVAHRAVGSTRSHSLCRPATASDDMPTVLSCRLPLSPRYSTLPLLGVTTSSSRLFHLRQQSSVIVAKRRPIAQHGERRPLQRLDQFRRTAHSRRCWMGEA